MAEFTKHVLVVDDEEILRRIGASFLARIGLSVLTARSGHDAVSKIREGPRPDLIITDINMKDGTGIDLLRFVKTDKESAEIPVIVLSGTSDSAEIDLVHDLGCAAFFPKPARYRLILDTVAQLLGLRVRVAQRYPITVSGWLHVGFEACELATRNLSESGMLFETQCQLEIGNRYCADLSFPTPDGCDRLGICFSVVRKVEADGELSGTAGYGVQFVFENDDQRRALAEVLQWFAKES